jgi:hypothetical protein
MQQTLGFQLTSQWRFANSDAAGSSGLDDWMAAAILAWKKIVLVVFNNAC